MAQKKPKYKAGHTVYFQPKFGMHVHKCTVKEVKNYAANTCYHLISEEGINFYTAYEYEMSKRPERLVKRARKSIEENYAGGVRNYREFNKELEKLCK